MQGHGVLFTFVPSSWPLEHNRHPVIMCVCKSAVEFDSDTRAATANTPAVLEASKSQRKELWHCCSLSRWGEEAGKRQMVVLGGACSTGAAVIYLECSRSESYEPKN